MSAHTYKKRVLQSISGTFRSPKVGSKWCKIEKVRKWSEWSKCSKDLKIIRGLNLHKFQEAARYKRIFISFLAVIFQILLLYIFTCQPTILFIRSQFLGGHLASEKRYMKWSLHKKSTKSLHTLTRSKTTSLQNQQ